MLVVLITDSKEEYLKETDVIDYKNPLILAKANEIRKDCNLDIEMAKALFEYVRDEIDHSFDINASNVTKNASEVLIQGHGICYAKSNLLAAFLRACGIPAGLCYQKLLFEEGIDQMCIHSLNALYLESIDKWIRVDARGNKSGVNAIFDLEKEMLAFEVREELGEVDYLEVYTEPLPIIVHSLQISKSVSALKANLPQDIS